MKNSVLGVETSSSQRLPHTRSTAYSECQWQIFLKPMGENSSVIARTGESLVKQQGSRKRPPGSARHGLAA
jgi:hypothetical protein